MASARATAVPDTSFFIVLPPTVALYRQPTSLLSPSPPRSSIRDVDIGQQRALRRRCGGTCGFDGAVDQRGDFTFDAVEFAPVEQCRFGDPRAENSQAIAPVAQTLDLI